MTREPSPAVLLWPRLSTLQSGPRQIPGYTTYLYVGHVMIYSVPKCCCSKWIKVPVHAYEIQLYVPDCIFVCSDFNCNFWVFMRFFLYLKCNSAHMLHVGLLVHDKRKNCFLLSPPPEFQVDNCNLSFVCQFKYLYHIIGLPLTAPHPLTRFSASTQANIPVDWQMSPQHGLCLPDDQWRI